jgi:hypothetical protein
MEATTRATSRASTNRERPVVIRHGLRSPHAETLQFRRTAPGTSFANTGVKVLNINRIQLPTMYSPGEQSLSPNAHRPRRRAGFATTKAKQNSKSP